MKAVVFDLDDTLLRDDLTISDFTVSTLRRLHDHGIHIIPASGRAKLSMKPFVDRIDCASLYISCNGAEIWDGRTHQAVSRELFSVETGREIASFGVRHHCYSQTYAGEYFYYSEHSIWADRYAASSMLKGIYVGDLEAFIQEPRNKILMMDKEEKIASLLPIAAKEFEGRASVTCSKSYFLEFNPPGATKGLALKKAADLLSLSPDDMIAFGDSLNDLSMLEAAGRSVMMSNGRTELRFRCDDVCLSNNEDGVADYLIHFFPEVFA